MRALTILASVFPRSVDLQRLVDFDYLTVHSGDAGGPESLHASTPMRSGELLVRRQLIERGLLLMMSRGLIRRVSSPQGIEYVAEDAASPFLKALSSSYLHRLKERADWVAQNFAEASDEQLRELTARFFREWTTQFQPVEEKRKGSL